MRASHIHVAIVGAEVAGQLVAGTKRIESRLYCQKRLPYDRIAPGDTVCFKLSGGEVIGSSTAARVLQFDDLTPQCIERLRRRYNRAVCAPRGYWRAHRHCQYGVLIWLVGFGPPPTRLRIPRQYGSGWITIPAG